MKPWGWLPWAWHGGKSSEFGIDHGQAFFDFCITKSTNKRNMRIHSETLFALIGAAAICFSACDDDSKKEVIPTSLYHFENAFPRPSASSWLSQSWSRWDTAWRTTYVLWHRKRQRARRGSYCKEYIFPLLSPTWLAEEPRRLKTPWGLGARPNWSSPGWGFFQPRAIMWRIGLQRSLHSGEGLSNKASFSLMQKKKQA